MKKFVCSLLILILSLSLFSACSNSDEIIENELSDIPTATMTTTASPSPIPTVKDSIPPPPELSQAERIDNLITNATHTNCNIVIGEVIGYSPEDAYELSIKLSDGQVVTSTKNINNKAWGEIYGLGAYYEYGLEEGDIVVIYYTGILPEDGNLDNAQIKSILTPKSIDPYYGAASTANELTNYINSYDSNLLEFIQSFEDPQILSFEDAIIDIIATMGLYNFSKIENPDNSYWDFGYKNGKISIFPEHFNVITDKNGITDIQFNIVIDIDNQYAGTIIYDLNGYVFHIQSQNDFRLDILMNNSQIDKAREHLPFEELVVGSLEDRKTNLINETTHTNCNLLALSYVEPKLLHRDIIKLQDTNGNLYTLSYLYIDFYDQQSYGIWGQELGYFPAFEAGDLIYIYYEGAIPENNNLNDVKIKSIISSTKNADELREYVDLYDKMAIEYIGTMDISDFFSYDDVIANHYSGYGYEKIDNINGGIFYVGTQNTLHPYSFGIMHHSERFWIGVGHIVELNGLNYNDNELFAY